VKIETLRAHPNCKIGSGVEVAGSAEIILSQRESLLVLGDGTQIYDLVCIRFVGGEGDIVFGEHCYLNPGVVLYSGNGITLGDYVLVAPGVKIVPTNHAFISRDIPIRKQGFMPSKGGVVVRDDVWIGANAVLLDGAMIGRGAVVAAGSVVNSEIPEFEIWGGVPAKKIGDRP